MKKYTTYIEEIEIEIYNENSKKLMIRLFKKMKGFNKPMWLEYNPENTRCEIHTVNVEYKNDMAILVRRIKREYIRLNELIKDLDMIDVGCEK